MHNRALLFFVLPFFLSSCDKIQAYAQKQTDLEKRLSNVEQQITVLQRTSQLNDSSFNDCVLENMKGINSDLAAVSVKEACLAKVSVQVDTNLLQESKAAYGQLNGYGGNHFGLYITINNKSPYTITQMTIRVINKATGSNNPYVISEFPAPAPPGVLFAGPTSQGSGQRLDICRTTPGTVGLITLHTELFYREESMA